MDNILNINILVTLVLIMAPVVGYLVYEALSLKDKADNLKEENKHLKEDMEKMERSEKIKNDFMGMAAHQMKTPLTKMKWALQALPSNEISCITPQQKELLDVAKESNDKMIRLISDLMGVKETEDPNLGYDFKLSSIEEVIQKTIDNFKELAEKKKVELSFVNETINLQKIILDPWKITLAVGNLIDNAVKYTSGKGRVVVKLENFGNAIKISVKDNGMGIPREEQEKIFTRFFRASNAMNFKAEGTGLGLYIARSIIKIHGGELWFNSIEGEGTTFYFTVPFDAELRAKENIKKFSNNL